MEACMLPSYGNSALEYALFWFTRIRQQLKYIFKFKIITIIWIYCYRNTGVRSYVVTGIQEKVALAMRLIYHTKNNYDNVNILLPYLALGLGSYHDSISWWYEGPVTITNKQIYHKLYAHWGRDVICYIVVSTMHANPKKQYSAQKHSVMYQNFYNGLKSNVHQIW